MQNKLLFCQQNLAVNPKYSKPPLFYTNISAFINN